MTINKLRELVEDVTGLSTRVKNDIIYAVLSADDDFRYDVGVAFSLTKHDMLQIRGFCSDLKVSSDKISDAILHCNKHNNGKLVPTAFYDEDDRDFNLRWAMDTENATEDCIRSQIKLLVPTTWRFFVDAGKEF